MKTLIRAAILAAIGLAPVAHAEIRTSGFGQFVVGKTSGNSDSFPARAYGDRVNAQEESLLGVQVDVDLGSRVTGTVQAVARGEDNFKPEIAWAYLNAQLGHGFSAKLGRQRLPFYRYSDFLDVGYAYPWIRPPVAMYNQPWSNADGISLSHSAFIGKWFSQAELIYGQFEGDANIGKTKFRGKLKRIKGVTWDMEYNEWLSLRAAYLTADVTIDHWALDPLTDTLRLYGQGALADRLAFNNDKGTFENVGFRVDKKGWLVIGEYTRLNVKNSLLDGIGRTDWYATVGHRFGKFTPHYTYGQRYAGANTAPLRGIPVQSPFYGAIAGAVYSQRLDENYNSVGVRWDVTNKVALKADYTKVKSNIPGAYADDLASAGVVFTF